MALVRLGQFDEAAVWGVKAAARDSVHAHILAIAACSLALAGRLDEARTQIGVVRKRLTDYGVEHLLGAMQFAPDAAALFKEGARGIGIA